MIRAEPDDFVRPPADALAQIMLQCARDDPSLVRRSRGHAKSLQIQGKRLPAVPHDAGPALMLLSASDQATKQHLEDLVSIAVASAERADNVLQEANVTRQRATRAIWACGSIAVVGIILAAAGVVSSRPDTLADSRVTQIAGEVRALGEKQQLASHQLADIRSQVADERMAAASTLPATEQTTTSARSDAAGSEAATAPQAVAVPPSPPLVTAPVSPVQHATYSSPWPQYTRPVQSTAYSSSWPQYPQPAQPTWSARRRQVAVPRFVVVIQQNLRSLFR